MDFWSLFDPDILRCAGWCMGRHGTVHRRHCTPPRCTGGLGARVGPSLAPGGSWGPVGVRVGPYGAGWVGLGHPKGPEIIPKMSKRPPPCPKDPKVIPKTATRAPLPAPRLPSPGLDSGLSAMTEATKLPAGPYTTMMATGTIKLRVGLRERLRAGTIMRVGLRERLRTQTSST